MRVRKSFQTAAFAAVLLVVVSMFAPSVVTALLHSPATMLGQGYPIQPPIPTGQVAITGAVSGTTLGSVSTYETTLITAPSATQASRGLGYYLYQISCVNTSATATVLTVWDSSTTGQTPGVSMVDNIACPASGAASGVKNYYPTAIAFRPGSSIAVSTATNVTTAYASGQAFLARVP